MSITVSRRSGAVAGAWVLVMAVAMGVLTVLVPPRGPGAASPSASPKRTGSASEFSFTPEPTVRDRAWRSAAVELTTTVGGADSFHFVISAGGDGYEPITSVRPLWRQQQPSPAGTDSSTAGSSDTVRIALLPDDTGGGPSPQQWEALGLLLRQLHQRHGVTVVGLDDRLRADPNATGLRTAAAW